MGYLVEEGIEQEKAKVGEKDLVDERIEQEKAQIEEKYLVEEGIEQEKAKVEDEDDDEVVVKKPEHLINKHKHEYTYAHSSYTKALNKPKYTLQDRHKASTSQAPQAPQPTTFEIPACTYKTYFQPRQPSSNSVFQHQYVIEEVPALRRSPPLPQNVAVPPPPPPTSRIRRFLSVIFCCIGKN